MNDCITQRYSVTAFVPLAQVLLLEHNVRFGDPECQGLLSRLDSDLLPALQVRFSLSQNHCRSYMKSKESRDEKVQLC